MADQANTGIEECTLEFLGAYYAKHQKKSGPLINKRVPTHQGTIADALIAYQKHDNTFFAASLSLSGSDKIAALLGTYKRRGLGKSRYLTAVLLFAIPALITYENGQWILLAVLPLVLAVAGFYLHSLLRKRYFHRQLQNAVEDLKQQPADHQWISVGVSSLSWRGNPMADYLSKLCERKGVGLVTLGKRSRLTLRQEPRPANCRRHDFLSYYVPGEVIRQELADQFMRVA